MSGRFQKARHKASLCHLSKNGRPGDDHTRELCVICGFALRGIDVGNVSFSLNSHHYFTMSSAAAFSEPAL